VDRFAGGFVPDDGGFALVGDADGGDLQRGDAGLVEYCRATATWLSQMAVGLCSTQPGCG
jgi:hypothetical protein